MPDYNTQFQLFIEELVQIVGPEVEGIGIIGSQHGISNPEISDIDLLVLDKDTTKGMNIFSLIRELEKKYLGTTHSKLTDSIQKNFLASNDYHGVHIIYLGLNELNTQFRPQSFRLRFLSSFFISFNLFVHSLSKELNLLYGNNLLNRINLSNLTILDRFRIISFPITLLPMVPLLASSKQDFIIWTIKCLKYFIDSKVNYLEVKESREDITIEDLKLIAKEQIKNILGYRYFPDEYKGNLLKLYLQVWWFILVNAPGCLFL